MKLFLTSYFKCVAPLLRKHYSCEGKKVAFITTASKVEKVNFFVKEDKQALENLGFLVEALDVSEGDPMEVQNKIKACDCVCVEGGNTFYLLQELKRSGADKAILEHIQEEKLYIGVSAGSMVLAQDIEYVKLMDDPSHALELKGEYRALGVVDFCIVPHYLNPPFIKAANKMLEVYGANASLMPIGNHQAVFVQGNDVEVLSAIL